MLDEQPDYRSYLLRLWRENGEGGTSWRASLESALTGERHVFPSLIKLFSFLQGQTVAVCDVDKDASAMGKDSPETSG